MIKAEVQRETSKAGEVPPIRNDLPCVPATLTWGPPAGVPLHSAVPSAEHSASSAEQPAEQLQPGMAAAMQAAEAALKQGQDQLDLQAADVTGTTAKPIQEPATEASQQPADQAGAGATGDASTQSELSQSSSKPENGQGLPRRPSTLSRTESRPMNGYTDDLDYLEDHFKLVITQMK